MATAKEIQNLYIAYFNRPADVDGLAYWQTGAQANMTAVQIAELFSAQKEYASAFANFSTSQTINALYKNLFNHAADSAGLTYWVGQINNGTFTIGQAAIAILTGATGADAVAVTSKFNAASAFTSKMSTNTAAILAYNANPNVGVKSWLAGVVDAASSNSAISGIDALFAILTNANIVVGPGGVVAVNPGVVNSGSAGNDTFNAVEASLTSSGTIINGNGGADVLNVTNAIVGKTYAAVVNGVSTLNLQQGGDMSYMDSSFLNQFSTINYSKAAIAWADYVHLGSVSQTLNMSNSSGTAVVWVGAPDQAVNQVSNSTGNLNVVSTNANLSGLRLDLANVAGPNNLSISDSGTASLSASLLKNISRIYLDDAEVLTLSPVKDIAIYQTKSNASTKLTSTTGQTITVSQNGSGKLTLEGNANYMVTRATGTIVDTGTAGTLTIADYGSGHAITSSVFTTIDAQNLEGIDTLNGTGNFVVNNFGANSSLASIVDGGALNGSLTVNVTRQDGRSLVESTGTGNVTLFMNGSFDKFTPTFDPFLFKLTTSATHTTTVNAVNGVNVNLKLSGNGNIVINGAANSDLNIFGSAGLTTVSLAASSYGHATISVSGSTLGNITSKLVTVNNFKLASLDLLKFDHVPTSLGTINIGSSDFGNLANNIANGAGTLTNNDYKAFIVKIASGTAAGTYVYEHTAGTTTSGADIIVKLTGTTGNIDIKDFTW